MRSLYEVLFDLQFARLRLAKARSLGAAAVWEERIVALERELARVRQFVELRGIESISTDTTKF